MKKILLALSLFISFASFAQVDSSTLNVTFSLSQAEWAYIFDSHLIDITTTQGEAVYDKVKTGARGGGNAASPVSSDTIDARIPFTISAIMRGRPYAPTYLYYDDIHVAIRKATGPGAAWLKRQLDILDAADISEGNRRVQRGTGRLKKTNQ